MRHFLPVRPFMGRADNKQQLVLFSCQCHHEEGQDLVLLLFIHMCRDERWTQWSWPLSRIRKRETAASETTPDATSLSSVCDFPFAEAPLSVLPGTSFFGHKVTDCHRQGHGDFTFLQRFWDAALGQFVPSRECLAWASVLFSPALWNADAENKDYVSRTRQC